MSSVNPSYEEFMTACMADGTDESVCKARWNAANNVDPSVPSSTGTPASTGAPVMGDADVRRENEMLKARIKLREDQLKQAIDIANKANEHDKAIKAAQREDTITRIIMDSDSKWTRDELKDKTLTELNLIKTSVDKSMNHTFASIAAYQAETDRKNKPQLTAGHWDPETRTWKGGL